MHFILDRSTAIHDRTVARTLALSLSIIAAGLWLGGGVTLAADAPDRILIVTIDGGRSELGLDREMTPALSSIAARGLRATLATTPTTETFASTAALLTGAAPWDTGVRDEVNDALPRSVPTIAGRLVDHGYAASALPGDFLCHSRSGIAHDFDTFVLEAPGLTEVDRAERALELLTRDGRQLVWLGFSVGQPQHLWLRSVGPDIDSARYVEQVRAIDDALSLLIDELERRGLTESTLVVCAGTHGIAIDGMAGAEPVFDETPLPGRGVDLADDVLRVPLLMAGPGVTHDVIEDRWVSTLDIVPTLIALVGDRVPDLDGQVLLAPVPADRILVHETDVARMWGWRPRAAVRSGSTKLIAYGDERRRIDGEHQRLARGNPTDLELVLGAHLTTMRRATVFEPPADPHAGHAHAADDTHDHGDTGPDPVAVVAVTVEDEDQCYLDYRALLRTGERMPAGVELVQRLGDVRDHCPGSGAVVLDGARVASMAGGDHTGAVLFLEVIEHGPLLPEAGIAYADHLLRFGRYEIAAAVLGEEQPVPMLASEHAWRLAFARIGVFEEMDLAEQTLMEAGEIGPPPGRSWSDALPLALEVIRTKRFVDEEPDRAAVHLRAGRAACEFGLWKPGFLHLNQARVRDPEDPVAPYWIGHYLSVTGRHEQAVNSFERCLTLDPDHIAALRELADAHMMLGQLSAASEALERAVEAGGTDPTDRFNLACLRARGGHLDAAMESLEAAVALGYADWTKIQEDDDLEPLRSREDYGRLVSRAPDRTSR